MASSRPTLRKRIDDRPSISREMVGEAEAIFHGHLKRVGLKLTGQRDAILRTFLDTRDHLSTDEMDRLGGKQRQGPPRPPPARGPQAYRAARRHSAPLSRPPRPSLHR